MMNTAMAAIVSGTNWGPDYEAYYESWRVITRAKQLQRLGGALEPLYWQAARIRGLARSYRGFNVGCAVYAYRADAGHPADRWGTFYGMNVKVNKEAPKICAEVIAISAAYAAGYTEVLGIVVVGEPQLDVHSGLECKTLHPCHECRLFLRDHPIVPRHARIITALPPVELSSEEDDKAWWETQTLNQLLRLHKEST